MLRSGRKCPRSSEWDRSTLAHACCVHGLTLRVALWRMRQPSFQLLHHKTPSAGLGRVTLCNRPCKHDSALGNLRIRKSAQRCLHSNSCSFEQTTEVYLYTPSWSVFKTAPRSSTVAFVQRRRKPFERMAWKRWPLATNFRVLHCRWDGTLPIRSLLVFCCVDTCLESHAKSFERDQVCSCIQAHKKGSEVAARCHKSGQTSLQHSNGSFASSNPTGKHSAARMVCTTRKIQLR